MTLTLIYCLCGAVALGLLWIGLNPIARYRYRHIPGPFALPFIGHLLPMSTIYIHIWFKQLHQRYGPIFKVWYGPTPWVVVCDPEATRKVTTKCNNRFMLPNSMLGPPLVLYDDTLLLVHMDMWRLLRKAWDPATLHTSSLQGYAPLLQQCAASLAERLATAESSGEAVDMQQAFIRMALEATGQCAYGINFSPDGDDTDGWGETGRQLYRGATAFFRSQELENASAWVKLSVLLPPLQPLFKRLAYLLPDKGHRDADQGSWDMIHGSQRILEAARQQREQSEGGAAAAAGAAEGRKGLLPGSFAVHLEEWRSKLGGEAAISDLTMVTQVESFVRAAIETTSTALAVLVYHLAVNPEAQRKVHQELDAVLGGRPPAFEDVPKLPYLDACIKEALRLNSPAAMLARVNDLQQPLDLLGYSIPRGARLMLFTHGSQTDGTYWERVDEFLPERFLPEAEGKLGPHTEYVYLPFGTGARKCVGYRFAELEMSLAAATLLARYSFSRPAGEGPLRTKTGLTTGPVDGVRVLVHSRQAP